MLKPVYLLPHGLPQLSDIVLMGGLLPGAVLMFMHVRNTVSYVALAGGMFVALTVVVNLINYFFIPDTRFILSAFYYPYNFMVFLFVVFLFSRDVERMTKMTLAGIVIGLAVQAALSQFFPSYDMGSSRVTGSFSNPNQLAYWALLSAGMMVFLHRGRAFGWIEIGAIILAGFLQTLALSKAGLITYGLFMVYLLFIPQVPRFLKMAVLFLLVAGASYFSFSAQQADFDNVKRVVERLQTIGVEADDSLAGRGYDRIAANPGYLFVGAGEGGFQRFQTWGGPDELHSGLATVVFSYGVLGLGFFLAFLFFIFYRQPWYCLALLFIVLLFSVTSQTIRFTHTWVFLGIAYGSFIARREERFSGQGEIPEGRMQQRQ